MKPLVIFALVIVVSGLTSCCRYRGYCPAYADDDIIAVQLEKKDLKKEKHSFFRKAK